MKEVAIIQRILPHYRVPFFNGLKDTLSKSGVKLRLIYGESGDDGSSKKDESEIEWGTKIKNTSVDILGATLYWQPALPYLRNCDLVIAEQANKNLINYLLILKRNFSNTKFAFWGHGRNRQANERSFGNSFKNLFLKQCSWWFAYTEGVKTLLVENGFPQSKVTVVQNAIDTRKLHQMSSEVSSVEVVESKLKLGITSNNIAVYCGGMYKEKRLDFLIEACDRIKQEIPDFHILFIGSGADAYKVSDASASRSWMHYLGPKFDQEKVIYFKMSKAFLMPGLVGLAILDSFTCDIPMITTHYPFHSPEIDYLENEKNGLIVEDNIDSFASGVINYFSNPELQAKLVAGCKMAYKKYSMEQMVENFANGILNCLKSS